MLDPCRNTNAWLVQAPFAIMYTKEEICRKKTSFTLPPDQNVATYTVISPMLNIIVTAFLALLLFYLPLATFTIDAYETGFHLWEHFSEASKTGIIEFNTENPSFAIFMYDLICIPLSIISLIFSFLEYLLNKPFVKKRISLDMVPGSHYAVQVKQSVIIKGAVESKFFFKIDESMNIHTMTFSLHFSRTTSGPFKPQHPLFIIDASKAFERLQ